MAEIRWSLTVESDLQEIEEHIARDSVLHAVNFIDRLVESTEQLRASPRIGKVVPEFGKILEGLVAREPWDFG